MLQKNVTESVQLNLFINVCEFVVNFNKMFFTRDSDGVFSDICCSSCTVTVTSSGE